MTEALVPVQAPETALIRANLNAYADAARGAYADNTARALRADMAVWSAWCRGEGLLPLPATPEALARFIDAMASTKAPATIRRYCSSIASMHRAAALPNPADALAVRLALKRLHREKGRAQRQAAPLNRELVDRMLVVPDDDRRGKRNVALLALAYDTLARRGELAAIEVQHIQRAADGSGTVLIVRSKTDQEGSGMVRYISPTTMAYLGDWFAAAGLTEGPAFRTVSKSGRIGGALTGADISRVYKEMALAAGLPAEEVRRISGHSTRVGAAQDLVEAGVELPAVMQSGGWRTAEMVGRYTARLDARRSGAAKLARLQGRA